MLVHDRLPVSGMSSLFVAVSTPDCPAIMQYMIAEMKEAGVWPSPQIYSMLMDGYAVVNQPRKAAQLMQDCIDDGHKVTSAYAALSSAFHFGSRAASESKMELQPLCVMHWLEKMYSCLVCC